MQLAELKEALLSARKEKHTLAVAVLSSLVADFEYQARQGKEVDGTSLVRKYIANAQANSVLEADRGNDAAAFKYASEVAFLENLLPKQLTDKELRKVLVESNVTSIGAGMKFLKENYAGQYDGKVASKLLWEIL